MEKFSIHYKKEQGRIYRIANRLGGIEHVLKDTNLIYRLRDNFNHIQDGLRAVHGNNYSHNFPTLSAEEVIKRLEELK